MYIELTLLGKGNVCWKKAYMLEKKKDKGTFRPLSRIVVVLWSSEKTVLIKCREQGG